MSAADRVFSGLCRGAALLIIVLALLLVIVLLQQSWAAMMQIGPGFLINSVWEPEPSHRHFGALAFIYGTVSTSAIALMIAVPLGVATAAFLSEYAPYWLQRVGAPLVEMLAAVPSVVYGFWGLFVLAPLLQAVVLNLGGPDRGGVGILPAGIVLAIMIIPYISSITYDVFRAVPRAQREGGMALGATRWQILRSIILPYAKPGIIGGCFIALGRALGETMAVTMLIGNSAIIKLSLFATGNSIASVIANEFTEATYDLYLSALVELGLVLMLVSVTMNALAKLLLRRMGRPARASRKEKSQESVSTVITPLAIPHPMENNIPVTRHRAARRANGVAAGMLGMAMAITIAPLFFILGYLLFEGLGALDWNFFTQLPAPVGENGGGMANAMLGSAMLVGLATVMAVPVGFLAAVYLAEYRSKRLGPAVRFIAELLASVPSIVIGIFAYSLVVRPMGYFSGWAGAVALAIMMVPVFMRAAEEGLLLVSQELRHASDALGARRWQTVMRVVLPAALPTLITALFLSVARIAGETAPLLLTASSNQYWPTSPSDFMPSLPVYIFNYAVSPYADWHRQAWAAALVLLAVIMTLNIGVRIFGGKRQVPAS